MSKLRDTIKYLAVFILILAITTAGMPVSTLYRGNSHEGYALFDLPVEPFDLDPLNHEWTIPAGYAYTLTTSHTGNIIVLGTLIMEDTATVQGTVSVRPGGEFNMLGGTITGAGTPGVLVIGPQSTLATAFSTSPQALSDEPARFTMYNGSIHGNNFTSGGGVNVSGGGIFTMYDGYIYNNTSISRGGGVYVNASTFTMRGGTIQDNTTINGYGGGLAVSNLTSAAIFGGTIADNTATRSGGGISVQHSTFHIMGPTTISDNTAAEYGGGIAVLAGANASARGATIFNNEAPHGGGLALFDGGYFNMFAGSIASNNADYGGGVYIDGTPQLYGNPRFFTSLDFQPVSILNNHATYDGGGIFSRDYVYECEIPASAFTNLYIGTQTTFSGNTAGEGSFTPPCNHAITNINGTGTSPTIPEHTVHQLNNYDINFAYGRVEVDPIPDDPTDDPMADDPTDDTPADDVPIDDDTTTNPTDPTEPTDPTDPPTGGGGWWGWPTHPILPEDEAAEPDYQLTYTKSADLANGSHVIAGHTITYTITITNQGPDESTPIVIEDPIPHGLNVQRGSISHGGVYTGALGGNQITWELDPLDPGQSITLTFDAVVAPLTYGVYHLDFINIATVNGSQTNPVYHTIRGLVKNPDSLVAHVGQEISWTLSGFTNPVDGYAHNFAIVDIPNPGLNFVRGAVPAFTHGDGITYEIRYRVGGQDWQVYARDIDASQPFQFELPQPGDLFYSEVGLFFGTVPPLFGLGDEIEFTFIICEAVADRVVNSFLIIYNDTTQEGLSPYAPGLAGPCAEDDEECIALEQCPPDDLACIAQILCAEDDLECIADILCPEGDHECIAEIICAGDNPACDALLDCDPYDVDCLAELLCDDDDPECLTAVKDCAPGDLACLLDLMAEDIAHVGENFTLSQQGVAIGTHLAGYACGFFPQFGGARTVIPFATDHHNFMIGRETGYIMPHDSITRGEVATILYRLISPAYRQYIWADQVAFADVNPGRWYSTPVATMAHAGILRGMPGNTFEPSRPITRGEMAALLARLFEGATGNYNHYFTDTAHHWAADEINFMASLGIIEGFPSGYFAPHATMSRAQAAAIFVRLLSRVPYDVDSMLPGHPDIILWPDNRNTQAWYYIYLQQASNATIYVRHSNGQHIVWQYILPPKDWQE